MSIQERSGGNVPDGFRIEWRKIKLWPIFTVLSVAYKKNGTALENLHKTSLRDGSAINIIQAASGRCSCRVICSCTYLIFLPKPLTRQLRQKYVRWNPGRFYILFLFKAVCSQSIHTHLHSDKCCRMQESEEGEV